MSATSRIISALVALCAFSASGDKLPDRYARVPANAGLAFELKPEKVEPGERARLTVALPLASVGLADVDEESELPALRDDLLLEAKEIQVLDRDFRRERDHLIWTFDVAAHKDGKYNLPPLEVRFGPHTFSTEAVTLTVKSSRAAGDEALRPDYESIGTPWRWGIWLLIFAGIVLLVVAWKKSQHRRRLLVRIVTRWWHHWRRYWDEPAPEAVLRREIAACRDSLFSGHPASHVLDRATRAVRFYLAHRKESAANAYTTEELRSHALLSTAELEAAFIAADKTKFGPGDENASAVTTQLLDAAAKALTGRRTELAARSETFTRAVRRWLWARFPFLGGGAR